MTDAGPFWERFLATYRFRRKFGRESWWDSFWDAIRAAWQRSDDEPEDDMRSFRALIEANVRGWNPYWSWRDKPTESGMQHAKYLRGRVCAWLTSSRENEDKT